MGKVSFAQIETNQSHHIHDVTSFYKQNESYVPLELFHVIGNRQGIPYDKTEC
jgi:hypothetical protein